MGKRIFVTLLTGQWYMTFLLLMKAIILSLTPEKVTAWLMVATTFIGVLKKLKSLFK